MKLGYGGTKTEMERLVKEASQMKDVQKELGVTVDGNSMSYANIVKAIHVVQGKMKIFGTTEKEAAGTITGSLNAMKAAWSNLMPALIQGGDSFDQCVDNLVDTVGAFYENIKPAILKALSGVADLVEELSPEIEKEIPKLVDELLPPLIDASLAIVNGLIKSLPSIVKTLADEMPNILKSLTEAIFEAFDIELPALDKFKEFLTKNSKQISECVPYILGLVGAFIALKKITPIFSMLFSKSAGTSAGKGGLLSNISKSISELGKTKTGTILKGMANMAIIIGGFVGIAALIMALAPHMAELAEAKSLIELIAVIGVLGVVGKYLATFAGTVGKIPVSTVAKGLANMSIMLAGMSALFLLIGAVSLIDFDYMKILQLTGVITVLGLVATALSVFAGIVGMIPVATVALGLANMGIIIAGMSALFLLIGAATFLDFDYKKIVQIIGIIGLLGTVSSVLAVFAGIVGMIPIPVVLAGLTNMGLVLGGLTALILAYGKLSEVEGFNEFITKGGETLANLFNVIGNIAGSLIGGMGEGISNSLPTIGENLSKFAKSLQPLFDMVGGVNMEGLGNFFKAIGTFFVTMTGEKVLSFFAGETDYAKLGTDLSTFATNSAEFFNKVAAYPENGFTNATKLFECLAGLKGLPKEGGVVGWFTGNINYETMASGLSQLSSEKVSGFFAAVAEYPQAGFDNATKLFDCLAGLKSLPKDGGVVGWFCGDIDYSKIATGLGQLSGEGVANFFKMVGGLSPQAFENTELLFESLASIKELPKEGGWWDKVTGEESTALSSIANELSTFSEKAATFFTQVNALNLNNLNGLWDSLNRSTDVTDGVSKKLDESIADMVKKISELPKKMGDGLKSSGSALSNSFAAIWQDAVNKSAVYINKLISGANWVLQQFGAEASLVSWTPYAKGTGGHKGGNALVNDGRGAELVQMPNGNTFIPRGRNVFIPNAPQGMKVLSAENTAALMGRKSPTFNYASGNIDIWDYIDNASGLVNSVSNKYVSFDGASSMEYKIGKSLISTVSSKMSTWVDKLFDEFGALSLADYVPSKGVEQWRSTVIRALKMEGQYSSANVDRTLYQMQTESGGNPRAINLWDSNAKKGIPSKGLMQVIDPTFAAYARNGFNKNIYDPFSNILASVRYAVARYGSLPKAYRGVGYENGGLVTQAGWISEYNKPEMVIPLSSDKRKRGVELWHKTGNMLGLSSYSPEQDGSNYTTNTVENNSYAPVFNLTINGASDDRAIARKVKQWINEALDEAFENMTSKHKRVREV